MSNINNNMNFKQWCEDMVPNVWGFDDENVDARQLDAAYDKAHIAVEIVRMYDQFLPKDQKILNNISTIANFNSGAYGFYNSSQNRKIIPPKIRDQIKMRFGEDYLKKYNLSVLPRVMLKKYFPEIQDNQIKSGDVINVNVGRILREFGDSLNAILEIASTIVHESTHEKEREKTGITSEVGPKAAEQRFKIWAKSNYQKIIQKFPQIQTEAFDFGKTARTALITAALGLPGISAFHNYMNQKQPIRNVDKKVAEKQQLKKQINQVVSLEDHMNFILPHEGSRNKAYNDSRGIRTIGVGMNLEIPNSRRRIEELGLNFRDVYSGKASLNDEQIRELFSQDVQHAMEVARRYIPKLDEMPRNVQLIVVNMTFNLGSLRKFPALREAINNRDWQTAANEMVNSRWYRQVGNRSRELTRMMREL